MAVGSPFLRSLELERHGLEWRWPEVDLAHPLDDGSAGVMRALDRGDRARARRRRRRPGGALFGARRARFDALDEDILRPILHVPRHPLRLARFGLPAAAPATAARRARWTTPQARALFGGVAAHAFSPLDAADELVGRDGADQRLPHATAGRSRGAARRRSPTPWRPRCASTAGRSRPASGALADELARGRRRRPRPRPRRGRRDRRRPAARTRRPRLPPLQARARRLQGRPRGRGRRAVASTRPAGGPAPSTAVGSLRGDRRRRARRQPRRACPSAPSSSSASSTWPTRSARAGDVHPVWAYAHVPSGYHGDAERGAARPDRALRPRHFASGSSPTSVRSPAELEAGNANYVGGDIITGANTPVADADPPAPRARPVQHRHPRRLHLLGGDPARRRRPRHERVQRRPVGAALAQSQLEGNRCSGSALGSA